MSDNYIVPSVSSNDTVTGLLSAEPTSAQGYPPVLIAFLALQIAGSHVLLPFLLATFWFTSAKRNITLINLFVCFVVTGIVLSMLLYTGQYARSQPDLKWCMAQASLSYAVAPMDGTAVLCLLFHVWNSLRLASGGRKHSGRIASALYKLRACAPFIVGLGFAGAGVAQVLRNQAGVQLRSKVVFFCTVRDGPYVWSTTVATATPLVISLFFIASIAITLTRSMRATKRESRLDATPMDLSFISRVVLYGGYVAIGLVLTTIGAFFPSVIPDMFCATIPLFIGVLFGSQKDVWTAWRKLLLREPSMDEKDAWTRV